jgi:hypothetical protein
MRAQRHASAPSVWTETGPPHTLQIHDKFKSERHDALERGRVGGIDRLGRDVAGGGAVEVARPARPNPVQRPAAPPGRTRKRHPAAAPLAAGRASSSGSEARRKKAEQDVADKKKADDAKIAAIRADNCARAKEQLRTLDSGIRIAWIDAKGEREVLDDTARAAEGRRARDVIASECK